MTKENVDELKPVLVKLRAATLVPLLYEKIGRQPAMFSLQARKVFDTGDRKIKDRGSFQFLFARQGERYGIYSYTLILKRNVEGRKQSQYGLLTATPDAKGVLPDLQQTYKELVTKMEQEYAAQTERFRQPPPLQAYQPATRKKRGQG